jgi:hypothetical protein
MSSPLLRNSFRGISRSDIQAMINELDAPGPETPPHLVDCDGVIRGLLGEICRLQGEIDAGGMAIIEDIASEMIWIRPIGKEKLLGWAVARRVIHNSDSGSSRIDHLVVDPEEPRRGNSVRRWKSPFRDSIHLFPSAGQAMAAAVEAASRARANPGVIEV